MKKVVVLVVALWSFLSTMYGSTSAHITVFGIGRLGLCTALVFEKAGFHVLGVDINEEHVRRINEKRLYSPEPHLMDYLAQARNFKATTSLEEGLNFSDMYFIIVPTPNGTEQAYDHTHLNDLLQKINDHRVHNKQIVICCTVFPGYIETTAKHLLKDCDHITLSYNPEFIAQGSIIHDFENPDVLLIGQGSPEAGDYLEALYKKTCHNQPKIARMSVASAEIAKLALNCFITTKIAYANMIADIADATPHANKQDILKMVGADSRVGAKCLKPGFGFGGPCFPRDNRALGLYAQSVKVTPLIPLATDMSNKMHAQYMCDLMLQQDRDLYYFEDVNYKENCNVIILEESQKLAVAELLAKKGKRIVIKDRPEVVHQVKKQFGTLFEYETVTPSNKEGSL